MPIGYLSLRGEEEFGDSLISNQLEIGLISFLQWGFLNIGGFDNYEDETDAQGYNMTHLMPTRDPNFVSDLTDEFTASRVWEGRRIDWVWESGISYASQPIPVSGVSIDGTFYDISSSGNPFYIDYPNGRVVFTTPVSISSTVKTNHSARAITITTADAEWFKRILTFSSVDEGFGVSGSGERDFGGNSRIQLPAVAVEAISAARLVPLQLGKGQILFQDVTFSVVAETSFERNNIVDRLMYQNNVVFYTYDVNQVLADGEFPLDSRGMLANNNQYPDLINSDYRHKKCTLQDLRKVQSDMIGNTLFTGVVRGTIRVEMIELV